MISKNSEVGQCVPVEAVINSEQLAEPAECQPRILLVKHNDVYELVDEMKRSGLIEPSFRPRSSPVVLVKKKDGSTDSAYTTES